MKCKLYSKCGSSAYNCCDDFEACRYCEARMMAKIESITQLGDCVENCNEIYKKIADLQIIILRYIRLNEEVGMPLNVDEAVIKLEKIVNALNELKNNMASAGIK